MEDIYNGSQWVLAVRDDYVVETRHGIGSKGMPEGYEASENGLELESVRSVIQTGAMDMEENIQKQCDLFRSEDIIPKSRCNICYGIKNNPDHHLLITTKRGARSGQRIFVDEAYKVRNKKPGSVMVTLEELPHPIFRRYQDDLVMIMYLSLAQSLCGFENVIQTLDNRKLLIKNGPGNVIRDNDYKCIMGEGMPKYFSPMEKGRLIIQFKVNLPSTIPVRDIQPLQHRFPPRQIVHVPPNTEQREVVNFKHNANG